MTGIPNLIPTIFSDFATAVTPVSGTSAIDVFRLAYKGFTFSWGYDLATDTCLDIKTGVSTTNAHCWLAFC